MPLVDTHTHIWDPRLRRYDWLSSEPLLDRPFLPDQIDLGRSGVTHAVFVQADAAPEDSVAEAAWVQAMASSWPGLSGIVAQAPVESDRAAAVLDELGGIPLVVGVRRLLQDEPLAFIISDELAAGLREVAARRLVFDACVRWTQLDALADVLLVAPEVPLVLDHCGKPPVSSGLDSEAGRRWTASMRRLAVHPQVTVKLSGLAPEADPARPLAAQAAPFLAAVLDLFGADRCMVGSDWPVSTVTPHELPYDAWFSLVLELVGSSQSDLEAVRSRTATRVYGLPVGPDAQGSHGGAE